MLDNVTNVTASLEYSMLYTTILTLIPFFVD